MKMRLLLAVSVALVCLGGCSRAEWNLPKVDPSKEKQVSLEWSYQEAFIPARGA